jgi:hypothetical protein
VRDLSRIAALDALPRLMHLAAGQTARLVKAAKLHIGDAGIGTALLGGGSDRLRSDRLVAVPIQALWQGP